MYMMEIPMQISIRTAIVRLEQTAQANPCDITVSKNANFSLDAGNIK